MDITIHISPNNKKSSRYISSLSRSSQREAHAGRRERDLLQKVVDIRLRVDRQAQRYRIRRLLRKHTVYIDGGRAIEIIRSRAAVSGAATATSSRSPSIRRGRGESLEGKLLHWNEPE